MKRYLFLTLAVLLCTLSASASDYDFMVDSIAYFKNDDGKSVRVTSGVRYKGDIVIPENVTYDGVIYSVSEIGFAAFKGCYLKSITIPNSVTKIGNWAFWQCAWLRSVTIPNSVTKIGDRTFEQCPSLTSIIIPNSVTEICETAFMDCTGLASITIPNSVTKIGRQVFKGCTGLTSITIPNSVTEIGSSAFSGCAGLTSVTIPNTVTFIGQDAFDGTPWYNNQPDGVVYIGNIAYKFKGEMASGTAISIKEGTLSVTPHAFTNCAGLTSVTIPNSVIKIGYNAFDGCTGLTSVTIPNSVSTIGGSAFDGCTGLTSVTIGNSVTEIGSDAFNGCYGLTSVTIPNSVIAIGFRAFQYCTGLTSVTIGKSVTEISTESFNGCTGLTSVTIGNSVTKIGSDAFNGCRNLVSVTIPNSVTEIGNGAFKNCDDLKSVTIPNSVTEIGFESFAFCTGLTSVIIGNSVTTIGAGSFSGCTGLTSVTIPNSVTKIDYDAFNGCSRLTSVTIPNSVTKIGWEAFMGCKGLTSVTIPNSVAEIGYDAFYNCTGLSLITIGNSVSKIGERAFKSCTGLKKVYSLNSVPPVINENTFSSYDAGLFVPQGSLSAYKSAKGWSNFSNIKEIQETIKAESISLNKQSANLMIGETLSLAAKVLPENASTKTVVWSSNNPEVASVNDEGLVTALTAGTALISATTTDGTVLSDSATIVVSTPTSSPSLSVGNYLCVNGDIVTVALSLANKQEIGGFQTDFTVPDGFAVALNSKGKYDITLNADRCVDHVVTTNKLSDGSIRVLAYSPSAEPFIGESGEICYIKLVADEDVKEGDHQLIFREILISESNGKGHRCDDLTSVLSTLPVILGDVNNDHKVNVQDVLLTANVSVGKDVDGFVFRAADVNKDGIINVSDVLLVANIAVGNSVTVSAAPRFGESHDVLHVSDFMLNPGEERTVDVMLDNTVDFSALQMNLRLPAGVNLKKVALTGRATDGHAVVYNENTPGNINLMAFAASTENFTGNEGAILKLTLQADKNFCGDGAIELTDVKLAESDGYTREADDASARISAVTTGVEGVYSVVCAYAEGQSIVIEAADAGKAQIVRPNGVMQEVKVNVGRNTYPMADGGIYFIRFAGKTFKVII